MVVLFCTFILVFSTLFFDSDSLKIDFEEIEALKLELMEISRTLELLESEQYGMNEHIVSIDERLKKNEIITTNIDETVSEQGTTLLSLGEHYDEINYRVGVIINDLSTLENNLEESENKIDSLNSKAESIKNSLSDTEEMLQKEVKEAREYATNELNQLSIIFSRNKIYGIGLSIFFLLLFGLGFVIIRNRIRRSSNGLYQQIQQTRSNLESETLMLDNKLIQILESQLKILQSDNAHNDTDTLADHFLALKIADEVTRLERNLNYMDDSVKGYKQLKAGLKRIKDNFVANGYEIVDLINKKYDERMGINPVFKTDEKLNKDIQKITRVIKPQVKYKGKLIQTGEVEVTQGV